MKKYTSPGSYILLLLLLFCSCRKDHNVTPVLTCNTATIQAAPEGETVEIDITSNIDWKLVLPEWISADKNNGKGDMTVTLTIGQTSEPGNRQGNIMLEAVNNGISAVIIPVSQARYDYTGGWQHSFKVNDQTECYGIVNTSDGGTVIMSKVTENLPNNFIRNNLSLVKILSNGVEDWNQKFNFISPGNKAAIVASTDGIAYLTVSSNKLQLVKLNNDGTKAWDADLDYAKPQEQFSHVVLLTDGFLVAYVNNNYALKLLKINSDGTTQILLGEDAAFGNRLISQTYTSADGSVYISGVNVETTKPYVYKTDLSGNKKWDHLYGEDGANDFHPFTTMAEDGTITMIYSHYTDESPATVARVVKISPDGNTAWEKTLYNNTSEDYLWSPSITINQEGYLVGGRSSIAEGNKNHLLQLNKNGERIWETVTEGNNLNQANIFFAPVENGFIAAGTIGTYDTGTSVWYKKFNRQ